MGQEFELKFRATPAALAAVQAAYSGFTPITMETTYYDTPDLKLSFHQWMLRRRMENGVSICTFKTPPENGVRGEWEVESDNVMLAVMELCRKGATWELTRCCTGGLMPICSAQFTRQAATLEVPGATIELALDQGVLKGRSKEAPLCELEVELKAGSQAAAEAFARELAQRFCLEEEKQSKFVRAMCLNQ